MVNIPKTKMKSGTLDNKNSFWFQFDISNLSQIRQNKAEEKKKKKSCEQLWLWLRKAEI